MSHEKQWLCRMVDDGLYRWRHNRLCPICFAEDKMTDYAKLLLRNMVARDGVLAVLVELQRICEDRSLAEDVLPIGSWAWATCADAVEDCYLLLVRERGQVHQPAFNARAITNEVEEEQQEE